MCKTMTCLIALGVALAWGVSAPAGEGRGEVPAVMPYHEIIARAAVVAVAKVKEYKLIELTTAKDTPQPAPAQPTTEFETASLPVSSSYLMENLHGQPAACVCVADMELLCPVKGLFKKGDVLTVNMAYALGKPAMQAFVAGDGKQAIAQGAISVIHLVPLDDRLGIYPRAFRLLIAPWAATENDLERRSEEMRTRLVRYSAFLQIDMLLANSGNLSVESQTVLRELATGKRPGMGEVKLLPAEQALLDRALAAELKSKEFTVCWRQWWSQQRSIFVDQPFRIGG